MSAQTHSEPFAARVLRRGQIAAGALQPLYAGTRLLKGAVLEAEQLATEARRIKRESEEEAQRLVAKARAEAESVRQEAVQRGLAEANARLAELLANLEMELARQREQYSMDVQRVAFALAKTVLNVEFQLRPERVVDLVRNVLKSARMHQHVRVHLHPDNVELARPKVDDLRQQLPFAVELQFHGDPELGPQGVRIETEMGTYDGSVQTQMENLEAHVLAEQGQRDSRPGGAS